jgi:hypothetical protein
LAWLLTKVRVAVMGDPLIRDLRVPKMNAASTMAEAADEIERLRSLIEYWADVVDDLDGHPSDYHRSVANAEDELRKAVGHESHL